jgi:hypothetical protein
MIVGKLAVPVVVVVVVVLVEGRATEEYVAAFSPLPVVVVVASSFGLDDVDTVLLFAVLYKRVENNPMVLYKQKVQAFE